jgi:hypothetical protein
VSSPLVPLRDFPHAEPRICCPRKREVCNERVVLYPESEKYYVESGSMALHTLLNAEVAFAPRSERDNTPIEFDAKFRPFHE